MAKNHFQDYIPYMAEKFGAPNPYKKRYFYDAMDYFREDNDGDTVFFYVSDDMEWGRKNLRDKHRDLYFVGKWRPQYYSTPTKHFIIFLSLKIYPLTLLNFKNSWIKGLRGSRLVKCLVRKWDKFLFP